MQQTLSGVVAAQSALGADAYLTLGEVAEGGHLDNVSFELPQGASAWTGPGAGNGVRLTVRQLRADAVVNAALATLTVDNTLSVAAEVPAFFTLSAATNAAGDTGISDVEAGDTLDVLLHQIGGTGLAVAAGGKVQAVIN